LKGLLKNKIFLFILGLVMFFVSLTSIVLLTFGYRDFSWGLTGMFFLAAIIYPLSIYIVFTHNPGTIKKTE